MKIGFMEQAELSHKGGVHLREAAQFAAGTRTIGTLWLKTETVGHWRRSHYWPWSAD